MGHAHCTNGALAPSRARAPRHDWKQLLELTPVPLPPAELPDEEAFRVHARALTARNSRAVTLFIVALGLITGIPDRAVFAHLPGVAEQVSWIRGSLAGVAILSYLGLRFTPLSRRPLVVGFLLASAACALVGFLLGCMGGLETPWFHFTYPIALCILVPVVPLGWRIALGLAFPASLLAGLAGARPALASDPMFAPTVGFLLFVTGVGVTTGHVVHLLVRQRFFHQRAQRRSARAVEDINATLERRVRAQTHELRMLMAHLENAREDERARIARELHDELGQELTALRYALALLRQRYERNAASVRGNISELESLLGRTAVTTRQLVSSLRPRVLDDLGLDAAAEWLVRSTGERSGLTCRLSMGCSAGDLDADTATGVFRVLQESLTNIMRHARATRVEVEMNVQVNMFQMIVRDDGVGMPAPAVEAARPGRAGMGLIGMRERVASLGGELSIDSAPGRGTAVLVRLPVPERRARPEATS